MKVKLYNFNDPAKMNNEKQGPITSLDDAMVRDEDKINQRLSGDWLIIGINYTFSSQSGNVQEVNLVRRELSSTYNKK